MRYLLLLLCLLLTSGCAARTAPVVVNLGAALANEKARWWKDGGGCHLVIAKADGAVLVPTVDDADCAWAETWVKAVASVPAPAGGK